MHHVKNASLRLGQKAKVGYFYPLITIYPLKKLTGTRNVLLDSLEDALETPRRQDTSKAARDFKIGVECLLCISSKSKELKTPLAPVRNQECPLRLLGGRSGDT